MSGAIPAQAAIAGFILLRVVRITAVLSGLVPYGLFSPSPGGAVDLTVSAGGVRVPDVLSEPGAGAVTTLQNAGLTVSTSSQFACTNLGEVLRESPHGGTVVLPGSTVYITVDSGTVKTCPVTK